MMNPKKPKKKEGEAVRIAEPDSSTQTCEVLISKQSPTKDKRKIKYVVKPDNQWGGSSTSTSSSSSSSELTLDTAESSDIEEIDWSSAIHDPKPRKPQDLKKNEDRNEKMARKYAREQLQELKWSRVLEEFFQEDVIVISDTESP